MIARNRGMALSSLIAPLLAAGCGAGVVGVAASSDNGGSGNSAPAIANLQVPDSKTSPAQIRFELSDREGESVRVELCARVPNDEGILGDPQLLTQVSGPGFPANGAEVAIPGGNQIQTVAVAWNFDAESFLPPDGSYLEDIQLVARLGSGTELVLGDDEPFSIGNDPPQVTEVSPIVDAEDGEAAGIVRVAVTVEDSSDDVVTVAAEFDVQGDVPDAGWMPATGFGLTDVQVSRDGTTLDFFWDTDTDLHDLERQVALRFTARDSAPAEGDSKESLPFRVDNNAAPIVQLDSGPLILNPDERRGIPIPFRVIDEEGDLVEVIFQWRREGEEFPSLDRDGNGKIENAEVDEILAGRDLRQEHHICTPYPHYAKGRVVPIDEDTVRLPELASSESWILASGIVGRTLELLRPSSIPSPITQTWSSNPLVSPVAALPVGDGLTALVLDAPGNGRLREIELASGAIVREIATLGPGIPSTMAFERGEKAVLVALDGAGTWRIDRLDITSGAVSELIVSDGTEPAPVRGLASLGTNALVFTAGSSLFHLDYRDMPAPQLGELLADLANPWGVAADPLSPHRIYVSERDANRVLAIELDSYGKLPVLVKRVNLQPGMLDSPEALGLERHGSRMLVVTMAPGGGQRLRGLDLGATGENRPFDIGAPTTSAISSIGTGPEELRLLCLSSPNELRAARGIEQRRVIAHSTSLQDITTELPFAPMPTPGQPWRIREETLPLRSSALGVSGRFLWDSGDAIQGSVFVRARARDDEVGAAADGAAPKHVRGSLEVEPSVLGGPGTTDSPVSVTTADLDGDGDLDLVSANEAGSNLTVFFQLSPGSFGSPPLALGDPATTTHPSSVAAADLDGDGDVDLVSANRKDQFTGEGSSNLTIFFQLSPGTFGEPPLTLGGPETTNSPVSVAAADLDGDGDLDLVSANTSGHNLTVFFQLSPGSFADDPLTLGDVETTYFPSSVAAADLDGDGDLDLVSRRSVFFQLSPGSFPDDPLVLPEGGAGSVTADLDGDGDQDLVSAGGDSLSVVLQLSPRSFAPPIVLGRHPPGTFPSVDAADLDGDGDMDLVSASAAYFQVSPGSFSPPIVFGGRPGVSIATADLDGDGDLDLVSANEGFDNLTVFLQLSPGSFSTAPLTLGGPATTNDPFSVAAADLDGDGDQDLVSANRNLAVFFQLSPGSFADEPHVLGVSDVLGTVARSVAAADLDGDGHQDLVSANPGQPFSNLTVFFQLSSTGGFSLPPLVLDGLGSENGPVPVAAADLDRDGDLDLVTWNADDSDLVVFFQLSPRSFAPPIGLGGPTRFELYSSVAAADLDGDGDQDLVSANPGHDNLTVFFQLSPAGSFAPLVLGSPATTDGPFSVAAADLDGDGDQDLASANSSGNNLRIFFQRSPGSFAGASLALGEAGTTDVPVSVAAADLDGDGDQDLASANSSGNNLTVFFQHLPGTFAPAPLALGGAGITDYPNYLAAADLDGDGDQDLISANYYGTNLTVFFGGR